MQICQVSALSDISVGTSPLLNICFRSRVKSFNKSLTSMLASVNEGFKNQSHKMLLRTRISKKSWNRKAPRNRQVRFYNLGWVGFQFKPFFSHATSVPLSVLGGRQVGRGFCLIHIRASRITSLPYVSVWGACCPYPAPNWKPVRAGHQ